jgi:steroid 5-alpha reductase family enzyme
MRADGKAMPVSVVVVGFCFNVFNSYLQARWISHYGTYPGSWLSSPQFLLGAVLFLGGFAGNIWADNVLLNLRSDKEDRSYKIPRGFLYEYVSCPNYFCEVVEWLGWAIMTNSLAGIFSGYSGELGAPCKDSSPVVLQKVQRLSEESQGPHPFHLLKK